MNMKDIIKKLELAETQLTGEPSEENAAEALLLIKDALQVLRQTDVSGALPLDRIKGMIKYDDCSMPNNETDKLRKHGVAEYNKAISDVLDVLRQ